MALLSKMSSTSANVPFPERLKCFCLVFQNVLTFLNVHIFHKCSYGPKNVLTIQNVFTFHKCRHPHGLKLNLVLTKIVVQSHTHTQSYWANTLSDVWARQNQPAKKG